MLSCSISFAHLAGNLASVTPANCGIKHIRQFLLQKRKVSKMDDLRNTGTHLVYLQHIHPKTLTLLFLPWKRCNEPIKPITLYHSHRDEFVMEESTEFHVNGNEELESPSLSHQKVLLRRKCSISVSNCMSWKVFLVALQSNIDGCWHNTSGLV